MNLYLELFGYLGTALVLLSMAMTSLTKLRMINISGSVISAVYAALMGTYPVVLLNVGLILINTVQLIRQKRTNQRKEQPS
ncbi:MAG: lactate dehydrogenase [Ruminococcaceae bacterium]|nr:lactate dehydrogenase [Oscillospiraceae bacterium]